MTRPFRVSIRGLPPERARRTVTLPVAGCCCCCCCCLHSIGGIVGAVQGGKAAFKDPPASSTANEEVVEESRYWRRYPVWVYWKSLAIAILLGTIVAAVSSGELSSQRNESAVIILIGVALLLPGVQLVASLIALIWIGCSSHPDKGTARATLGRMTAYSFLGALIGLVAMPVLGGAFGMFR